MNYLLTASAIAFSNIAFIKYWGNQDNALRIPQNGSISMNLDGLLTRTTVTFRDDLNRDELELNGQAASDDARQRVSRILDLVRAQAGRQGYAQVTSANNFPTGAGIASSAAAFAALSLAASRAIGLSLDEKALSRLARRGSGSASRSVPTGFVEWFPGSTDEDSFAASFAPPDFWDLVDCIAVVESGHKPVGSSQGHTLAPTSPLQNRRVEDAPRRLALCRQAILAHDFEAFASVVELDSNMMHGVMMTSTPPLFYWEPASVAVMKAIAAWRRNGIPVCYTLDAGPNVHAICLSSAAQMVQEKLSQIPGVQSVLRAVPGTGAHLERPGESVS
ncbi:MAG: diphosphomevalonate decarboxylase [Anaerolineaceae bacterium]|nr:diphosphomevalonate decarboxylase [Anaerolineaceae bacterium]